MNLSYYIINANKIKINLSGSAVFNVKQGKQLKLLRLSED